MTGGLRDSDNESKYRQMKNPKTGIIEEQKSCPHCGDYKFLDEFGYRKFENGTTHIQSWCRLCRSSKGAD